MNNRASSEDYLETILILKNKMPLVRAIDIANEMNFSKPSVSIALKKLKTKGLINVNSQTGNIEFTQEGLKIATNVLDKHQVISSFLISLGVAKDVALIDAFKLEHDLSEESFNKLKEFYEMNIMKK